MDSAPQSRPNQQLLHELVEGCGTGTERERKRKRACGGKWLIKRKRVGDRSGGGDKDDKRPE